MNRRALIIMVVCLLSACGFHLRGQEGMPFKTVFIIAPDLNSRFVNELRRNLLVNKVTLAATAEQADMVLNIASETTDQQILTLGGSGRVNEFELHFRVSLRAYDNKQQDWIPAEQMVLYRNYSYNDNIILAKEAEANMLYQGMRSEMVQQILRRLSHAKPQAQ